MTRFQCRVATSGGQIKELALEAESELALRRKLEAQDYYVFDVLARDRSRFRLGFGQRIGSSELLVFNQELMILIKAGIAISKALALLEERSENQYFKEVIASVRHAVESGESLSNSFALFPNLFSPVFISSLHAGETSGALVTVLKKFVSYQKNVIRFQKKIQQALIYPAILLGLVLAIIFIFLTRIVPTFSKMYDDIHSALPPATQTLVEISGFTTRYSWVIISSLIGLGVFFYYWKKTRHGAMMIDRTLLSMPLIGRILKKYSIIQFTKTLQTTLEGGIPLLKAITLATESMSNRYLAAAMRPIIPKIRGGSRLAHSLKELKLIPPMVVEMIGVGEETGSLEEMLDNVSLLYDEEIENNISALLAVIEPVLILIMGLIVTAILISMYLPIFEMADRIGV